MREVGRDRLGRLVDRRRHQQHRLQHPQGLGGPAAARAAGPVTAPPRQSTVKELVAALQAQAQAQAQAAQPQVASGRRPSRRHAAAAGRKAPAARRRTAAISCLGRWRRRRRSSAAPALRRPGRRRSRHHRRRDSGKPSRLARRTVLALTAQRSIDLHDLSDRVRLFGEYDRNLSAIESSLDVAVHADGDRLLLAGERCRRRAAPRAWCGACSRPPSAART